jgi:hypothetical protein
LFCFVGESVTTEAMQQTYRELLLTVNKQVNVTEDQCNLIVVNRANVLASAIRAIKRTKFQTDVQVKVEFAREEAQDFGGPRREFFW